MEQLLTQRCSLCGEPTHNTLYCPKGKIFQRAYEIYITQKRIADKEPEDINLKEEVERIIEQLRSAADFLESHPPQEELPVALESEDHTSTLGDMDEDEALKTEGEEILVYYRGYTPDELRVVANMLEQRLAEEETSTPLLN